MDAWSFANGKIFDENLYSNFFQEALEDILDKKVMEAMEKCTQKDENSCLLLEKYDKEFGVRSSTCRFGGIKGLNKLNENY